MRQVRFLEALLIRFRSLSWYDLFFRLALVYVIDFSITYCCCLVNPLALSRYFTVTHLPPFDFTFQIFASLLSNLVSSILRCVLQ